jgi:hypothetical protein
VISLILDCLYCRSCRNCSLFSTYCCFPKLDVAGSNPVSRSIVSITYESLRSPPRIAKALNALSNVIEGQCLCVFCETGP